METNYTQESPMPYGREGRMEGYGRKGDNGMADAVVFGAFAIIAVVFLVVFIFWLKMLINAIVRPMDNTQKILWVIVMLVVGWIGAIVYYFVVYRKALPAAASQPAVPASAPEVSKPQAPQV